MSRWCRDCSENINGGYHNRLYCDKCLLSRRRDRDREKSRRWRAANPERRIAAERKHDLKRCHGITPEEYTVMSIAQGGLCSICREPPSRRWLDVDHNHETGKIRSLLCVRCNTALGLVRERIWILREMMTYLEKHNERV